MLNFKLGQSCRTVSSKSTANKLSQESIKVQNKKSQLNLRDQLPLLTPEIVRIYTESTKSQQKPKAR